MSFSRENLVGRRFGHLTVTQYMGVTNHHRMWLCKCDCGNNKIVCTAYLNAGTTKSCGCYKKNFNPVGSASHSWKGGSIWKGYRIVTIARRQMGEHRHVMERLLGRRLTKNESVHHKNGNKLDNRPENLELWIRTQPYGQRVSDLIDHAISVLRRYAPERLAVDSTPLSDREKWTLETATKLGHNGFVEEARWLRDHLAEAVAAPLVASFSSDP